MYKVTTDHRTLVLLQLDSLTQKDGLILVPWRWPKRDLLWSLAREMQVVENGSIHQPPTLDKLYLFCE